MPHMFTEMFSIFLIAFECARLMSMCWGNAKLHLCQLSVDVVDTQHRQQRNQVTNRRVTN